MDPFISKLKIIDAAVSLIQLAALYKTPQPTYSLRIIEEVCKQYGWIVEKNITHHLLINSMGNVYCTGLYASKVIEGKESNMSIQTEALVCGYGNFCEIQIVTDALIFEQLKIHFFQHSQYDGNITRIENEEAFRKFMKVLHSSAQDNAAGNQKENVVAVVESKKETLVSPWLSTQNVNKLKEKLATQ